MLKDKIKKIIEEGKSREEGITAIRKSSEFVAQKYSVSEMVQIMNMTYDMSKEYIEAFEQMRAKPMQKTFETVKSKYFTLNRYNKKEFVKVFSYLFRNKIIPKIAEINKLNQKDPKAAKELAQEYELEFESVTKNVKKSKKVEDLFPNQDLTTFFLVYIIKKRQYQINMHMPGNNKGSVLIQTLKCIPDTKENSLITVAGNRIKTGQVILGPDSKKYLIVQTKLNL
jgi:hypothetical protein